MIGTLMLVTTVAVMPFKDLSGGKGQVGEAIRETVTSDLKDTGLKVVERGNIDKVIAEQNLQAKKNDLGMAESIRVGTLLGATMIVAGAYQRAASQVRVTARFVDVATGEIKGIGEGRRLDGRLSVAAGQDHRRAHEVGGHGTRRGAALCQARAAQGQELQGDRALRRRRHADRREEEASSCSSCR